MSTSTLEAASPACVESTAVRNEPASGRWLLWNRLLWALIVFWLGIHLWVGISRVYDVDELQGIASAWDMWRGQRLYTDFWDNHGPLLPLAGSAVFSFLPPDHWSFLGIRLAMWLLTVGLACGGFRLCRENFPRRPFLGQVAVLVLLCSEIFRSKAFEFRPDNPMNLLWVASLYFTLRGIRRGRSLEIVLGGACLGVIPWFSIKALLLGAGVFCGFVCIMWLRRRLIIKPLVAYGVGVAIPLVALVGYLAAAGTLSDFVRVYLHSNLSREHRLSLSWLGDLLRQCPVWCVLVGLAEVRSARRWVQGKASEAEAFLWGAASFTLFSYAFLLPTHFLQSLLSALVPVSVLVALMLLEWAAPFGGAEEGESTVATGRRVPWAQRPFAPAMTALVLVGLLPVVPDGVRFFCNPLWKLIEASNAVEKTTRPDEYVLSGTGLPLFRKSPLYAHSLVACVLDWNRSGQMDLRVPEQLAKHPTRLVVYDWRVAKLRPEDLAFLEAHYLPLKRPVNFPYPLLGAGEVVKAEHGKAKVDVAVAGEYWIQCYPGGGAPEGAKQVRLTAGGHELQVSDAATTVVLSAFSPEMLPELGLLGDFRLPSGKQVHDRKSLKW